MARCQDENDWGRQEFLLAQRHGRNIVPVREESVDLAALRQNEPVCRYPWHSPAEDLREARRLIEQHGYGRRLAELQDAEAALLSPTSQSPGETPCN